MVNDKRIRRVQRQYQLYPIRWESFKIATTDSNHGYRIYPNLLKGYQVTGPNQAWVADITYIRIELGFVYLAALLDRYSRKVIGWAISRRIDAKLCTAALRGALAERQPPPGCIHHSDRGVQHACGEYVALLEGAHMQVSMSRTANPYDNAHMESFFKTLSTRRSICRTMRPSRMSSSGFPISSRRCTTRNDCIRRWDTYPAIQSTQTADRAPLNCP